MAGTRTSRVIVASIAIADASPMPTSLIVGTPVNANDPNTTTMIAAADVMIRAEDAMPSATARSFDAVELVALADAREQEHLVVHREPERDREDRATG